jgi:hypothetical protein
VLTLVVIPALFVVMERVRGKPGVGLQADNPAGP